MPRLPQSLADRQCTAILARLDAYIGAQRRAGRDSKQIAKQLGFSYGTLKNRRERPLDFTLRELQGIANVMNIKIETLLGQKELI